MKTVDGLCLLGALLMPALVLLDGAAPRLVGSSPTPSPVPPLVHQWPAMPALPVSTSVGRGEGVAICVLLAPPPDTPPLRHTPASGLEISL